jgi:hypothetical protein
MRPGTSTPCAYLDRNRVAEHETHWVLAALKRPVLAALGNSC